MKAEHVLEELFVRLGLDGIEAGDDGAYGLLFDHDLSVACRSTPSAIRFESCVCVLPADPSERDALLEALLGESAARMRDQASVLHLDVDGHALMLYRAVEKEGAQVPILRAALEEFLSSLEHWRAASASGGTVTRTGVAAFAGLPMPASVARLGR